MVGCLCTACGKSFTQKVALRKHFYAIHKEDTCVCKECGKVLKSKSKLTNHLHSHEKITCSSCNKFPKILELPMTVEILKPSSVINVPMEPNKKHT